MVGTAFLRCGGKNENGIREVGGIAGRTTANPKHNGSQRLLRHFSDRSLAGDYAINPAEGDRFLDGGIGTGADS